MCIRYSDPDTDELTITAVDPEDAFQHVTQESKLTPIIIKIIQKMSPFGGENIAGKFDGE